MATDIFNKRGSALEDEFFRRVDERLAEQLREKWQHERDVAALKRESRIEDDTVIEELLEAGILPGMIQAMMLVPAIHVAWANGYVEHQERDAVLSAAASIGIAADSTTGQLLGHWLEKDPGDALFRAWQDYVVALHDVLDLTTYRHIHVAAVQAAGNIAEAAGGMLGVHAVSVAEKRCIKEIDEAFVQ